MKHSSLKYCVSHLPNRFLFSNHFFILFHFCSSFGNVVCVYVLVILCGIQEVKEARVCECKFFHTLEGSAGFAVMSNKYQFFVVGDSDRSSDEIRVKKLADFPSSK